MGRVSRLLTLDPRTRRMRIPREYLALHRLQPGNVLHMMEAGPETRMLVTDAEWRFLRAAALLLRGEGPDGTRGARLTLDRQGRVVLPPELLPGAGTQKVRLSYRIDTGILVLTVVEPSPRVSVPVKTARETRSPRMPDAAGPDEGARHTGAHRSERVVPDDRPDTF